MLDLTRVLTELLPKEAEALALAATVRYAEARRPARLDERRDGAAVGAGSTQWRRPFIDEADAYLGRALALDPVSPRACRPRFTAPGARARALPSRRPGPPS